MLFFVDGLLIDTGHSNAQKMALKTFETLPIEQILLTHYHENHETAPNKGTMDDSVFV